MIFNSSAEIIEDIRQGKMVILMDDEDRENEGDLIMAASCVQADDINFMARYGRGLICLTLSQARCERLKLPLMVTDNNSKHSTNFTLSIEATEGVTTGISAADRAVTVQAAVKKDAKAEDIVQPGHIFPLMAQPGGVLVRAGHTEAGCDLARLAGFEAASVIVEILNDDGSMARRPDLEKFAAEHDLKIGTIADLIHYRLANEKTVERVAETEVENEFGHFRLITYLDSVSQHLHFAMVMGEVQPEQACLVRVHVADFFADVLSIKGIAGKSAFSLNKAMQVIAREGAGVVVVLRGEEDQNAMIREIRQIQWQPESHKGQNPDLRTHGIGAQILSDIGVKKMRVLGSKKRFHGISGFGLEVTQSIDIEELDKSL